MSKKFPVDDNGHPVMLPVPPAPATVLQTFQRLYILRVNAERLVGSALKLGDLTCDTCLGAHTCLYAMDAYNTKGDCLAEK